MTQAQFDAMVDAISKAVADKLKNEGAIATPRPAPAPPPAAGNVVADQLAAFVDKAEHVFQGAPVLGSNLAAITSLLDESNQGGRSVRRFFLLLAVAAGVSLAAEPILRKIAGRFPSPARIGNGPRAGARLAGQSWPPRRARRPCRACRLDHRHRRAGRAVSRQYRTGSIGSGGADGSLPVAPFRPWISRPAAARSAGGASLHRSRSRCAGDVSLGCRSLCS